MGLELRRVARQQLTPYSATHYPLAQLNTPAEVLGRVTHRHYDAVHMMYALYTREADLARLKGPAPPL